MLQHLPSPILRMLKSQNNFESKSLIDPLYTMTGNADSLDKLAESNWPIIIGVKNDKDKS